MSVAQNISLTRIWELVRGPFLDFRAEETLADQFIGSLRIKTPYRHQLARNLSGGNQQKIVLGKWLATKPKLLIVDEPTRGIDVGARAEIHRLLDRLAREENMAIVVISSDLPEVLRLSDRIAVMREGRLVAEFTRKEADQEKVLAGVSAVNRGFIAPGNLVDIVYNSSYIGVAAIGMTMIILCGHIDISIGAALGVCATVAGKLAVAGTPLWIVFPVTVLVGGVIGLINGILVAYGRIPAIVATLGMASILKGGLILATGGKWIYGLPPGFTISRLHLFGVPLPICVLVVLGIVLSIWLRYFEGGRPSAATRKRRACRGSPNGRSRCGFSFLTACSSVFPPSFTRRTLPPSRQMP